MRALQILDVLHQNAVARRGVFVFGHEQFDQAPQVCGWRQRLGTHLIDDRLQPLDIAFGDIGQQVLLVAVIVIHQRLGYAACTRNIRDRCGGVTLVRKLTRRRIANRCALRVEAGGFCSGHIGLSHLASYEITTRSVSG